LKKNWDYKGIKIKNLIRIGSLGIQITYNDLHKSQMIKYNEI